MYAELGRCKPDSVVHLVAECRIDGGNEGKHSRQTLGLLI